MGRVLHDKAKQFHWSGTGSTSIKSFYHGTAEYRLDNGITKVDTQRYLLLNDNQPYTITTDSTKEVESFCVFFTPECANRGGFDLSNDEGRLLDDPFYVPSGQIEFIDQTYWHDDLVTPVLRNLREKFPSFGGDSMWLDEQLCMLLQGMLLLHTDVLSKVNKISSVRKATREELFRRVSIAQEVILERFRETLTLAELSEVAALSTNHLIRTYKQAFGVTPHQHIVSLRLQEAGRLLRRTSLSVSDVCSTVGFESLGSFSAAFRRKTGMSPLEHRQFGDFREDL